MGPPAAWRSGNLERLCLEAFQSGLSWLTVLRKRENFRAAFAGFDIEAVASFGDGDVQRLLANAGIIRNRQKITAAITNARAALTVPGGLSELVWKYGGERGPSAADAGGRPAQTAASKALSAELGRAGFTFAPGRSPRTRPCRPAASSTTTWRIASAARPEPGHPRSLRRI